MIGTSGEELSLSLRSGASPLQMGHGIADEMPCAHVGGDATSGVAGAAAADRAWKVIGRAPSARSMRRRFIVALPRQVFIGYARVTIAFRKLFSNTTNADRVSYCFRLVKRWRVVLDVQARAPRPIQSLHARA